MQKCGWYLKREFLLENYCSPAYTYEHCVPQPAMSVPDAAHSLTLSHMMLLPVPQMFKYLTNVFLIKKRCSLSSGIRLPTCCWLGENKWYTDIERTTRNSWPKKHGFRGGKKSKGDLTRHRNESDLVKFPREMFPFHQCAVCFQLCLNIPSGI